MSAMTVGSAPNFTTDQQRLDRLSEGLVERPYAYCCAEGGGSVTACDCVNKRHGTAWFPATRSNSRISRTASPSNVSGSKPALVQVSEAQAAVAVNMLERTIYAAKNGNQAGENAVVAAAAAVDMLAALQAVEIARRTDLVFDRHYAAILTDAAIAKATGAAS